MYVSYGKRQAKILLLSLFPGPHISKVSTKKFSIMPVKNETRTICLMQGTRTFERRRILAAKVDEFTTNGYLIKS